MTVDLRPLVDLAFNLAAPTIVTVLVPWLVVRALQWLHISKQAALSNLVLTAAENGAHLALAKGQAAAENLAANVALTPPEAIAANYVRTVAPQAVAKLGLTPSHLAVIVQAQLAKVSNTQGTMP